MQTGQKRSQLTESADQGLRLIFPNGFLEKIIQILSRFGSHHQVQPDPLFLAQGTGYTIWRSIKAQTAKEDQVFKFPN